jgi:hypothetical protein
MAALKVSNVDKETMMAHVYGQTAHKYVEYTLLIGAAVADTIDFIRIPANVRIVDFYETHDGANTAATTANFGLAAVAGGPTAQVDADYFLAAADLNAAGRNRWGNTAVYPILTGGEYYVRAVLAGANAAGANMVIGVYLQYEFIGNP